MRANGVGAWGLAALVLACVACSGGDDTSNTPVLDIGASGAGTCLDVSDELGAEVTKLPVIDCAEPHSHQIFAVVDYDQGDVFPGLEALETFAKQVCVREFEPYVGVSAFDSTLNFTYLTPTLGSWNDHDDREVLCVLSDGEAAPLVGSMEGSGR